jgi:hypothetical protein
MGLTLRSGAGMALTISEMDNNLLYLEGLTNYKEVSYEKLKSLYDGKDMEIGWYLITDFQTIYDLPDYEYNDDGNIVPKNDTTITSIVEPIFVRALSESQLSPVAYSNVHRGDILHYDINYLTVINYSPTKGLIYYREDTIQNVKVSYDFRNITFKRYNHDDNRGYVYFWDNGESDYQLLNTFINYEGVVDVDITIDRNLTLKSTGFDIPNTIFEESVIFVKGKFIACYIKSIENSYNNILKGSFLLSEIYNINNLIAESLIIEGEVFENNIINVDIKGSSLTDPLIINDDLHPELFDNFSCEIFKNKNNEIWYKYYDFDNDLKLTKIGDNSIR